MKNDPPNPPLAAAPLVRPRPAGSSVRGLARAARLVALLSMVAACAWWLVLLLREVEVPGFGVVDATRSRMDAGPGWVDPRWEEELRLALAELGQVAAEDPSQREALVARVRQLPFVAAVGEPRVLWPDGLELEIALREPVACLSVGRQFAPLCADGVLLSGRWPSPPARGSGFLPVVVPGDQTIGQRAWAGARLVDGPLEDALSIAESLWLQLEPVDLARLGRIVIDARKARETSVEQPGALLLLEGERSVRFGRSPNLGEPGELPVEHKWSLVSRALAALDPAEAAAKGLRVQDWSLLDARWDRGGMHVRGEKD